MLLTKEFLMTLRVVSLQSDMTVHFRLFNSEHELTLCQFSNALGFSPRCSIAAEPVGFNATEFWKELAGPDYKGGEEYHKH